MIRVSFKNLITKEIWASSEAKGYPVVNLLDARASSKWKSGDIFDSIHTVYGNFEEPVNISCFGIFNLVCEVNAEITVNLYLGATLVKTFTIPGEDIIYGYGEGPYGFFAYGGYAAPGREWLKLSRTKWFEDVLCDNWEVIVDQQSNIETEVGGIYFGDSWESPTSVNQNHSTGFTDYSGSIQRNVGGITVGSINIVGRKIECELHMLTGDDVVTWQKNADSSRPILFTIEPKQVTTRDMYGTIYGYLQNDIKFTGSTHKRFRTKLSIEEVK